MRSTLFCRLRSNTAICKAKWLLSSKLDLQIRGTTLLLLLPDGWIAWARFNTRILIWESHFKFQAFCHANFAWFLIDDQIASFQESRLLWSIH